MGLSKFHKISIIMDEEDNDEEMLPPFFVVQIDNKKISAIKDVPIPKTLR